MNSREKILAWASLLQKTRAFFDSRGFIEVLTPQLVPAGAFESSIDTLKVTHLNGSAELHSSPEMAMKEWLSHTKNNIYQITKCFRDDLPSPIHLKEFTLLEFYSVGTDYRDSMELTLEYISAVTGRNLLVEKITVRDAFLRCTELDLWKLDDSEKLKYAIQSQKILLLSEADDWDDMFFKLLVEKIEPSFDPEKLTVLHDYPLSQCALSKIDSGKKITERFEIYWKGMELCNGCSECTDKTEIIRRYEIESEKRKNQGKPPHPFPHRLMEALEKGLPPCSGVALGMDRLFWGMTSVPSTCTF